MLESGSCCGYRGKPLYEKKIELPFGRKRELSIILPVNEEVAQPDGSIQEGVTRPGKPAQEEAPQPDEPVREKGPRIDEPVKEKVTQPCGPAQERGTRPDKSAQEEAPQSGGPAQEKVRRTSETAKEEAPPNRPVRGGKYTERCELNRDAIKYIQIIIRFVDRDTVDTGFINVLILKLNNAAWRFTKNRFIDSKIAMKVKIDGSC